MAPGLDGIVFALTTSLIFTRLLVFPSQSVIRNSNYRTEDLGFYSGSTTIASSSYFDFVIDVLHSRGVPENTRHFQTRKVSRTYKNNVNQYQSSLIRLLILSGDIALNPGPVKYPCGKCSKPVRKNQKGIQCEGTVCEQWHHIKCINLPVVEYERLSSTSESWYCKLCTLPNFSDSYFDIDKNEMMKTNELLPFVHIAFTGSGKCERHIL